MRRKLRKYAVDVLWTAEASGATAHGWYGVDAPSKLDAAFQLGAQLAREQGAPGWTMRVLGVEFLDTFVNMFTIQEVSA